MHFLQVLKFFHKYSTGISMTRVSAEYERKKIRRSNRNDSQACTMKTAYSEEIKKRHQQRHTMLSVVQPFTGREQRQMEMQAFPLALCFCERRTRFASVLNRLSARALRERLLSD